jgi:hypothetical protein
MPEHTEKRNLLFVGAAVLTVGLIVELLKEQVLGFQLNVVYKTLIIMLMIAVGYSFASGIISPFVRHFLDRMKAKFIRGMGKWPGTLAFYIVIYGVLFGLYLLVYVYGIKMTSFPEKIVQLPDIAKNITT